jgi:hypothetical protein
LSLLRSALSAAARLSTFPILCASI